MFPKQKKQALENFHNPYGILCTYVVLVSNIYNVWSFKVCSCALNKLSSSDGQFELVNRLIG